MRRGKIALSVLLILFISTFAANAQIEMNGTVDISLRSAGANSNYITNNIVYEYRRTHLYLNELNLAIFAPVDQNFSVEARLKIDTHQTDELNDPKLDMAVLNWTPLDSPISLSLGRFVSPFGLYPKQQYNFQRSFITPPLAYSYYLPLSDIQGYAPHINTTYNNGLTLGRTSTMSYETLVTGIELDWEINSEKLNLQTAIVDAAPSATKEWSNQFNSAIISRLQWELTSYWSQGFSLSYGSFMNRSSNYLPNLNNPTIFRQMLAGSDLTIYAGPFTFTSEFIWSKWSAPRFGLNQFLTNSSGIITVHPALWSGYFDIRVDFPETNGLYFAVRADGIHSIMMTDPQSTDQIRWFKDTTRGSIAAGKLLSESILFKLVYSNQVSPLQADGTALWTLYAMTSVVF